MLQTKKTYLSRTHGTFTTELTMINLDHFIVYIWEFNEGKVLKAIRQGTRQACEVYRAVFMSDHNARKV